jgi:hypothetical protein
MALTFRLYRAARIGDGLSRATAFRSALSDYIVEDGTGSTFHDELGSGAVRYAVARCDSAVHAAIALDARIQALSPEFAARGDLVVALDAQATTLPLAARTLLIADGHAIGGTVRETFAFLLAAVHPSFVQL